MQLGLQQGKRSAALPPRPISDAPHRSQPAETSHLVSNFPYVCPEPALANVRFSATVLQNGRHKKEKTYFFLTGLAAAVGDVVHGPERSEDWLDLLLYGLQLQIAIAAQRGGIHSSLVP